MNTKLLTGLLTNKIFLSMASGWATGQGLKIIREVSKNGFDKKRIYGGGGMPSAHTATVTSLLTATAIEKGTDGFEFPMALCFSIIAIYDALNVRYTSGKEAKAINRLNEEREREGKERLYPDELEEKTGHTMPEVLAGAAVGIAVAAIVCNL